MLIHRAQGAVIGLAVGDALGAPFEFHPQKSYSRRFPQPIVGGVGEMLGDGLWDPGEFTDDTEMAIQVGESLLEHEGVNESDIFNRFRAWIKSRPKDVGISTRAVLRSGLPWKEAASAYYRANPIGSAGNGSLMRTLPAAIYFAGRGRKATVDAARRISLLTHGDPAAGDGCAIYHELVRAALEGRDPLGALREEIGRVPASRRRAFELVLAPGWLPGRRGTGNGTVWGALATAVWAIRKGGSFHDILVRAIDQGGDADTVGAITGGLAGAMYGLGAIPSRWVTYVHGDLFGRRWIPEKLRMLGRDLVGGRALPFRRMETPLGPTRVDDGLWVADINSAASVDPSSFAIVSLCRTAGSLNRYPIRRECFLVDGEGAEGTEQDENPALGEVLADVFASIDAFRAEGRQVLVHCFAGRSRTGFFLRAWLRRTRGLTAEEATREAKRLWPATTTTNQRFEEALSTIVLARDSPARE